MNYRDGNTTLVQYAVNERLVNDHHRMQKTSIEKLFESTDSRFDHYSLEAAGLFLDYSKNRVDDTVLENLFDLAREAHLPEAIKSMFRGDKINVTEDRAVLHTALRNLSETPVILDDEDIMTVVDSTLCKMKALSESVHNGKWKGWTGKPIRHIVNIGIGGSYLGTRTVLDALTPYHKAQITPYFISNIDPTDAALTFSKIEPETTLFIVASKSFGTLETLENAMAARKWMCEQGMPEDAVEKHFIAVSTNIEKAIEFGIAPENIFPLWDWVGGRYSLWCAIGLMIPLIAGFENFSRLIEGAFKMDKHFSNAPLEKNMPVILGLLGVWYHNYSGAETHAILPYCSLLKTFADHLQQVDMESNGKSVNLAGNKVHFSTGPVIWGNVGTDGQHAYHQLLHQGTRLIPVDFIVPLTSPYPMGEQQDWLVANAFAQSQALMKGYPMSMAEADLAKQGKSPEEIQKLAPHKAIPGNRPSNTITMDRLTPETMGALIALYEHKVFVQGVIWGINSFDQWGVELGKTIGKTIFNQIRGAESITNEDVSTCGLISRFQKVKQKKTD